VIYYLKAKKKIAFIILIIFLYSIGFSFIKLLECPHTKDLNNLNDQLKTQDLFNRDTNGYAQGVYIAGDYAYVAVGDYGLAIIDISDPTNPGMPVYKDTSGDARSVFVAGNYAFVADTSSGLAVIDISDPSNPGSIYYEPTTGNAYDVYVSGDYAYVAAGASGLGVVNISDPTNPGPTTYRLTPIPNAIGVYVDGNYAYISVANLDPEFYRFYSYDISDPTNPTYADFRTTLDYSISNIYVVGDYAYIAAGSNDLAIIDISNPTNLGFPIYANEPGADSYDVFVSGDYAYLAVDTSGLAVINISDPGNPGTPIYVDTPGNARGVYVEGDYAYLGDGYNGLVIIKIGEIIDPEPPYYESITNANAVQVVGDYAYVAASDLAVINISDPTNPGPVYYESSALYTSVYVEGNYAYLIDDLNQGLRVVDISDPTNPSFLAFAFLPPVVSDVFIEGDFAYVSSSDGLYGLCIVNISNPSDPIWTGTKNLDQGVGLGVHIEGNYAYVAAGGSGLAVIDITDPINPGSIYYEDTSGRANDVYIEGDYAYIADDTSGLAVIDISNPTNPGAPEYRSTSGLANGVWVSGDYAYVAVDSSGLAVIDISNPTNPGVPAYRSTSEAEGVCVEGDYAYIADWDDGLAIMKIMDPWYILEAPILDPISPWPDYDGLIDLNWNDITGATKYYVYRAYTPITTLRGRTPKATVTESMYQDNVFSNNTYYYAVVAANDRGNSFLSNFRSVLVTIDDNAPKDFSVISPTGWITSQTPTVIAKFYTDLSGVDVSTVQYAYSVDGNLYPNNWAAVTGVYYDEECTNSAYDGRTGWIYVKVENVQFNKDSGTDNTIRFSASDMVSNQGTQATASVIQIDSTKPGAFSLYSPTNLVGNQTPTVIAKFFTATSGVNISTVEYAYSTSGESAPINWAPVDGVFRDTSCTTTANDGDTDWLYAKVNEVPFNQDSSSLNTIRFRAADIAGNPSSEGTAVIIRVDTIGPVLFSVYSPADQVDDQTPTVIMKFFTSESGINISTVEYAYSTSGESKPTNWLSVDGVYLDAECTDLAIDGTTGWLFAKINAVTFNQKSLTQNTIRMRARDMLGNLGVQENATVIPIVAKTTPPIDIETIIIIGIIIIVVIVAISITALKIIKYRARIIIKSPKSVGKYSIIPKGAKGYLELTQEKDNKYNVILKPPTAIKVKIPIKSPIITDDVKLKRTLLNTEKIISQKVDVEDKEKRKPIDTLKRMGNSFYTDFIPKGIQDKLKKYDFRTLELGLDSNLLQFPWELFHDGKEFLGLKYSIGRYIIVKDLKFAVPYRDRGSKEEVNFLIIGDPAPKIDGKTLKLSGAWDEATQLNDKLSKIKNVNTTLLLEEEANSYRVEEELKKDYDFIHYCGHAYFDIKDPNKNGLLLNDGLFRASSIANVLNREKPPILAFINACKSSKEHTWTDIKYENQVSGLASAFLLNGINYIGSLWSIHDKVAVKTAESFYFEVLNNVSIGESLRRAKIFVHESFKGKQLGWASYILYGDPTYTLEKKE